MMNMLVGILCEVIARVAQREHEESECSFLKGAIGELLDCYDTQEEGHICQCEFMSVMKNPDMLNALQRFGVDSQGLMDIMTAHYSHHRKMALQATYGRSRDLTEKEL